MQNQELKIKEQNDKLKECLRVNYDTIQIANETNIELNRQDEQLKKIDGKLDDVTDELNKSKWLFRSIKSTFGMIKNVFTKPKKIKREIEKPNQSIKEIVKPENIIKNEEKNDILKQEDILDEILNGVDQLKHIAKNTGETLDKQNKTIEKITIKTEKNTKDMNKLNSDMKKYLK